MLHILSCLASAAALTAAFGILCHAASFPRQLVRCGAVFLLGAAAAALPPAEGAPLVSLCISAAAALAILLWLAGCALAAWGGRYRTPEETAGIPKELGKTLLVLPHPDDEFNLAGGTIPALRESGQLFVLFVTNGDINQYSALPCREAKGYRMREALRALERLGVPRGNAIFLGYGNEWQPGRPVGEHVRYLHLMNAPEDAVQTSFSGERETWGVRAAPCFNPGRPYTRRHLLEDMQQAILHIRPDTLVCVDDDPHSDHQAVSAAFDEAVAQLQKAHPDYNPTVLKGLSYSLAWRAERLFYAENMPGSMPRNPASPHPTENSRYAWHDCLRLPVHPRCCSRTLSANLLYKAFLHHHSQQYPHYAPGERIIRGDKIFWWLPTGNILLQAEVESAHPGAETLVDGSPARRSDVTATDEYADGWGAGLTAAEAVFRLNHPTPVAQVRLHKHPHSLMQELKIHLHFTGGGELHAAFPAGLRSLVLDVPRAPLCTGFTLRMESASAGHSGLTEVEAFAAAPQPPLAVYKLMDQNGRFMYDYTTPPDGSLAFSLYGWPAPPAHVHFSAKAPNGRELQIAAMGENRHALRLPNGCRCTLYARDDAGRLLDAARISNPGRPGRAFRKLAVWADKLLCRRIPAAQAAYYNALADWLYCALALRRSNNAYSIPNTVARK